MFPPVLVTTDQAVRTIAFGPPEHLDAVSEELYGQTIAVLRETNTVDTHRVMRLDSRCPQFSEGVCVRLMVRLIGDLSGRRSPFFRAIILHTMCILK